MTKNTRWMTTMQSEAAVCTHQMPWERGARRAEMIARQQDSGESKAKVTLPPMPPLLAQQMAG